SQFILDSVNDYGCITEGARSNVDALLHQQFRPEFLNRLDEIVFYKPLQQEEILSIVDLMLDDLRHRLDAKQLRLDVTDEAKRAVVDNSYDISYGARPIRRYLQQQIETQIARFIIGQDPAPGTTITVDYQNGAFTLQ
ncbi:MAG: type VI secretion system ATPase TssH, partial [Oscillospiraceae bacterium]|nr:type VI secretion system ATPase TssH [Oscillospiraceae bacterium]